MRSRTALSFHLVLMDRVGLERFDEAMEYVEKHQLYDHALSIWRGTDKYEVRD